MAAETALWPSFETARAEEARASSGRGSWIRVGM